MTYALYNFLWKLIDYFLINYPNYRVEKGKEIKSRLNERFGKCYIRKENKKIILFYLLNLFFSLFDRFFII